MEIVNAYRSTDDGLTFTGPISLGTYTGSLAADETAGCCIPDTAGGNAGDIATVYTDSTTGDVHLEQSHDGGASWTSSTVTTPQHGAALAAVSVLPDGGAAIAYDDATASSAGTMLAPTLTTTDAAGDATRTLPLATPFLESGAADGNDDPGLIGPEQDIATVPGGVRVLLSLADQPGEAAKDIEVYQAAVSLSSSPDATPTVVTPPPTTTAPPVTTSTPPRIVCPVRGTVVALSGPSHVRLDRFKSVLYTFTLRVKSGNCRTPSSAGRQLMVYVNGKRGGVLRTGPHGIIRYRVRLRPGTAKITVAFLGNKDLTASVSRPLTVRVLS